MTNTKQLVNVGPDLGEVIVRLLSDPSYWIDRKVESVQLNIDGTTRRSISFDFWLPKDFVKVGYIPLAPLSKEDLRTLNIVASDGSSLATLIKQDNLDKAVQLLASGLRRGQISDEELTLLTDIVAYVSIGDLKEDTTFKEVMLGAYQILLDPNVDSENYLELAQLLIDSFLIWVEIPRDAVANSRNIIKISYEYPLNSYSNFTRLKLRFNHLRSLKLKASFWNDVKSLRLGSALNSALFQYQVKTAIFPNWSARYHFEFRVPLGLLVKSLWIGTSSEDGLTSRNFEEDIKCPNQVSHLTIYGGKKLPKLMYAHIDIFPNRSGFPRIVLFSSIFAYLILAIPELITVFKSGVFSQINASSETPLMLLFPALFIGYLARPMEHEVLSRRYLFLRISLIISSGILVFASGILSGTFRFKSRWTPWWYDLILATLGLLLSIFVFYRGTISNARNEL